MNKKMKSTALFWDERQVFRFRGIIRKVGKKWDKGFTWRVRGT